jgi:hypothetical protein
MSNQIIGRSLQNKNKRYAYQMLAVFAGAFLLVPVGSVAARVKMPVQAGSQEAATPKLAGQWQLNKDQSDDPREKMQAARGDSGGGGRGEGGRNGEGRGQGGGMMDEMSVLQIEQTDSNVKITGKSGRVLAQIPAAAASSSENRSNGDSEDGGRGAGRGARTTSAQWQNGQLITVTQSPRGKSTRTYSLSPDGKQLYVTTKMENERLSQPVTYRQVYDPATTKAGGNQ